MDPKHEHGYKKLRRGHTKSMHVSTQGLQGDSNSVTHNESTSDNNSTWIPAAGVHKPKEIVVLRNMRKRGGERWDERQLVSKLRHLL
jgi:hypothetical protein